jgi:hypothetical protein
MRTKIIEKIEMSKLLMEDGRWVMGDGRWVKEVGSRRIFFNFRRIDTKFS